MTDLTEHQVRDIVHEARRQREDDTASKYLKQPNGNFVAVTGMTTEERLPAGFYRFYATMQGIQIEPREDFKILDESRFDMDADQTKVWNEFDFFWKNPQTYTDMRIPYKRGWLLEGPAGTGKSTLIKLLCSYMAKNDGLVLDVGYNMPTLPGVYDAIRAREPARPICFLMEGIDRYRDTEGLTDIMDGMLELNHVAFLSTTNFIERVEDRIKDRPSRFDRVVHIGYPDKAFRERFVRKLLGDAISEDDMAAIVAATEDKSMAHVKEEAIRWKLAKAGLDLTKPHVSRVAERAISAFR